MWHLYISVPDIVRIEWVLEKEKRFSQFSRGLFTLETQLSWEIRITVVHNIAYCTFADNTTPDAKFIETHRRTIDFGGAVHNFLIRRDHRHCSGFCQELKTWLDQSEYQIYRYWSFSKCFVNLYNTDMSKYRKNYN